MTENAYHVVDAERAASMAEDADRPWSIVDVRSTEEFDAGHPAGAWNLPVAFKTWHGMQLNPSFVDAVTRLFETEHRLIMSCAAGSRSQHACELLAAVGYRHLANLQGGYHGARDLFGRLLAPGWSACELPSSTSPEPGRSWAEVQALLDGPQVG